MKDLHLVLGGSGAVGQAIIHELKEHSFAVKAVERRKKAEGVETIQADLKDPEKTTDAIRGATYVYLCIGLEYSAKVWSSDWPLIVANVIEACALTQANLIFLDNVYMYGNAPLSVPFDETESQNPDSKKGIVRKKIAATILSAHKAGKVRAVIGRSADFYGPNCINSSLYVMVLKRMLRGKMPQWFGKPKSEHTYAFTSDNGRALVELALDPTTYGEVWHLPVGTKITTEDFIGLINNELQTNYPISFAPRPLFNLLALFVPLVKELKEMMYQFDQPYVMSYEKFGAKFPNFKVTSYEAGIKQMVDSFK